MKSLIAWFAENDVAANLLMVLIIVAGIVSLPMLRTEVFPATPSNEITVIVSYLGAGPGEVEENITIPIEQAVRGVANVKKIHSRSWHGRSRVTLQLDSHADMQIVMDDVQSRVDSITSFPIDIEPPRVTHNVDYDDIIDVIVAGNADQATLGNVAKDVRADLLALPEVSLVNINGLPPSLISIEVSEYDLRRLGISMSAVVRAIEESSVDVSLGSIRNRAGSIQIRSDGRAYTKDAFANITVLQQSSGTKIRLGEIADIKEGVSESFFLFRSKGKPSVIIETLLSPGQDVLKLTSAVKKYLAKAESEMPQGITVTTWRDDSVEFYQRLEMLVSNSLTGLLLVFTLLVLFLRLDLALWVTFGIVIAFSGAFLVLQIFDFSVNQISLFGFLLVLGIVVDDAIVVGEGIHASQQRGKIGLAGAKYGASSLALPIILSVLTTILAVFPLLFFESETGQQSRDIAIVVTGALIFSLVECLLILPCHLASTKHFEPKTPTFSKFSRFQKRIAKSLEDFSVDKYKPFVSRCLKAKYLTASLFFSALILFTAAYMFGFVRSSFNPEIPSNIVWFKVELSESAPEGTTEAVSNRMVNAISGVGGIEEEYSAKTGMERNILFPNYDTRIYGDVIFMQLEMSSEAMAILDPEEVMSRWQALVGEIDEAVEATLKNSRNTRKRGGDLKFYLSADSELDMIDAVARVKAEMADIDGMTQIYDSRSRTLKELNLKLKPSAEYYGLTLGDVSQQVRLGFYGKIVQRIPKDGETFDIHVRFPQKARENIQSLRDMYIQTPSGGEIPFNLVAEMEYKDIEGYPERLNGQSTIRISARMNKDLVSPYEAYQYLSDGVFEALENSIPGFNVIPDGDVEQQEIFFGEIVFYLSLALLAIYTLIAVGLRSYIEPLVILTAVPFGFVGAVIGHMLMGMPISLYSFLGLFAASGVVINDNLVLVDCIKSLKKQGMHYSQAIPEAGRMRFRAIILTSATTFVGLIPIMLETSYQALFIIPMVVSLTFGVLFATTITLVLVPCLYHIKDSLAERLSPPTVMEYSKE